MTWSDPDEGPSEADLDRFGDDDNAGGFCPDCGAEVWDQAEFCQTCGGQIGGRVLGRPKVEHDLQRRLTVVVVVLVLVGFVLFFAL
ncbi:MAG: zinc ribbon domain-containing protein [Phycisphaerales bacterium]|nr:zinc ribbon domain-containing protein [Phycisphaerales bacterium]